MSTPFFNVSFDCQPLAEMFSAINDRFDKLEKRCSFYEERSLQMLDALNENAQRLSVSENQYAAVFDTVSTLQKDVNNVQKDKLETSVHESTTARIDEQLSALRVHIGVVDARKQEVDIPGLMKRVTTEAKDVATKLLIERETEQRRYMENMMLEKVKVLDSDITKKTGSALQAAEATSKTTKQSITDATAMFNKRIDSVEKQNATTSTLFENFALKVLMSENCIESLSEIVKEDVADVRTLIRCVCHAFGVNADALLGAVPAHEKHQLVADAASESNTLRSWKWERLEQVRKQAFVDGWTTVRNTDSHVTKKLSVPLSCAHVADANTAMAKRDELVRAAAKTRKEQTLAENARTLGMDQAKSVAMPEAGKLFAESPVFVDVEARAVSAVRQDMSVLQQKVISDSTAQIQQLDRVVRSKISFDRAQQLVTEAADVASEKANEPLKESIEALKKQILFKEQVLSLVAEKVSTADLLNQVAPAIDEASKASRLAVEMKLESELMNQKLAIEKSVHAVRERCTGNEDRIDGLTRTVARVEADLSAVQLRAAASVSKSGKDTSGTTMAEVDRCLSCGHEIDTAVDGGAGGGGGGGTTTPGKRKRPQSAGFSPLAAGLDASSRGGGGGGGSGRATPQSLSLEGSASKKSQQQHQRQPAETIQSSVTEGTSSRVLASSVDDTSDRKLHHQQQQGQQQQGAGGGGGGGGGGKTGVPPTRPGSSSSEKENGPRGPTPPPPPSSGKSAQQQQQARPANWYQSMDEAFQLRSLSATQPQQQQDSTLSASQLHLQQLQQLSERTAMQGAGSGSSTSGSRPTSARTRPGGAWKNTSSK